MAVDLDGVVTVILAGTGSDDDFVTRAFGPALDAAGAVLVAPAPQPSRLVAGYLEALNDAAAGGAIAVGGVSIGAAVALRWALDHPDRTVAVLAALPPWTGRAGGAPAAASALHTAAALRADGLEAVTAAMRASSPRWLGDELARSWRSQWPHLPQAMEEAARYRAPSAAQLAALRAPMGVAGCPDDAVHPMPTAREWAAAAPRAALGEFSLAELARAPSALGDTCLRALRTV